MRPNIFFKNQSGNTMMMVMLVMAILGGTTYTFMKQDVQSKKVVRSVAVRNNQESFERRMKIYMSDIDICSSNLGGKSIGDPVGIIEKNDAELFKEGNSYEGGLIKILSMSIQASTLGSDFDFVVEYERRTQAELGAKTIHKRFPVKGDPDECYMDVDGVVSAAVEDALDKVCNGPGVVNKTSDQCEIAVADYEVDCSTPGQAIRAHTWAGNVLGFSCSNPVVQIGDGGAECPHGLKYDPANGSFSCFNLADVVDTASSYTVSHGTLCKIGFDASTDEKIKLICDI